MQGAVAADSPPLAGGGVELGRRGGRCEKGDAMAADSIVDGGGAGGGRDNSAPVCLLLFVIDICA